MYGGTNMTKPHGAAALEDKSEMAKSESQIMQNCRRT
jgi:hypothetical protein